MNQRNRKYLVGGAKYVKRNLRIGLLTQGSKMIKSRMIRRMEP